MRLHYFSGHGEVRNFGDELNRWLWPRVAPEVVSQDTETLFVGIGTLLNDTLPPRVPKVIFGAGVGYGTGVPIVDESWRLFFVRGPLSADALGIPRKKAITDPAILLGLTFERETNVDRREAVFVPHWDNAHDGWRGICEAAGVRYVDPTWPPDRVLRELASCRMVLAEAMHAAIAADAMRVPWVPIVTGSHVLHFKWKDWCAAMSLRYRPRRWLSNWAPAAKVSQPSPKRWIKDKVLVAQMRSAAQSPGMMSIDSVFDERRGACSDMLVALRRYAVELER